VEIFIIGKFFLNSCDEIPKYNLTCSVNTYKHFVDLDYMAASVNVIG